MKFHARLRETRLMLCALLLAGCTSYDSDADADASGVSQSRAEDRSTGKQDARPDAPKQAGAGREQKRRPNRLAGETSPYLLQHAHNPVDWYPWGPEAFERARDENKPVFLSIGYSSCHWCHVMERLVFEDEEIAAKMNEQFINIKVDREERPDIDDIYMTALQVYFQSVGSPQGGGWPLSMFLTPEAKPIAGGTYFPPEDAGGQMGFPSVMKTMSDHWNEQRQVIETNADVLTQEVRRLMRPRLVLTPVELERELVAGVAQSLQDSYDQAQGGLDFNPARPDGPKFPVPPKLALLQYQAHRHDDGRAAEILDHTLRRIADGGIHDHLAGGFHRYSTDRAWHVPHFEKMLYDQAQLADVYIEAYRQTHNPRYLEAAEGIFTYVLHELTDPKGGFYSALDAETDGIEGQYYVWSPEEIEEALGDDAQLFATVYGLEEPQVFEHGHVLHLPRPIDEVADDLNIDSTELRERLAANRQKLLEVRGRRPPLFRDEKVLTSWNGLMIRAFARAGTVLDREDYIDAAEKAARFVLSEMRDEQGRLRRTYRAEQAALNAYLDDYAFLVQGLLALNEATGDEKWLNTARRLTDDQIELFWDEKGKAFFFTPHHHEELIARTKNAHDSVIPSGNSVSVRNLVRLASLTNEEKYRQYARETLQVFAPALTEMPRGMAHMALALGEFLAEPDFGTSRENASNREFAFDAAGDIQDPDNAGNETSGEIVQVAAESSRTDKDKDEEELVTARAFLSVDRLPAGGSCQIVVFLKIQEGWHINANPARPDTLLPTRFTLESKRGTTLSKVRYPPGKELSAPGLDEPQHVYEKQVAIRGTLTVPAGAANGAEELELTVRYQGCRQDVCLPPRTVTLNGRMPVAAPGEPVKQINQNLFPAE